MVRFKVEAVQLHWVAADNHVIQSRQSSLTSLTGSWPAPIWSLSPLRLCSLQSQVCWWLAPCFWKSPSSWTMGSCMSCWSWCAKEQPLPDRLWGARDGVSYHIRNDCQHIVRNPADEIWTRTRQGSDNVRYCCVSVQFSLFLVESWHVKGAHFASLRKTSDDAVLTKNSTWRLSLDFERVACNHHFAQAHSRVHRHMHRRTKDMWWRRNVAASSKVWHLPANVCQRVSCR